MRTRLYFPFFFLLYSTSLFAIQISSTYFHTCATDGLNVKCWGDNHFGQLNIPPLRKPIKMVSAGASHSCAIDRDGVKCWGNNYFGESIPPKLYNPRFVSAGGNYTCAIDNTGLVCWGDQSFGKTHPPTMYHLQKVFAGAWHACAIDDGQIKCWGNFQWDLLQHYPHFYATEISTNIDLVVAAGGNLFDNWGPLARPEEMIFSSPTRVTAGYQFACVLDQIGIHCYGNNALGQLKAPSGTSFTDLASGVGHSCASTKIEVVCWGDNEHGQLNVPSYFLKK